MATVLKSGVSVAREIPPELLTEIPGARRALIVTIHRTGISLRGKGRRMTAFISWREIVARHDDTRKDLQ